MSIKIGMLLSIGMLLAFRFLHVKFEIYTGKFYVPSPSSRFALLHLPTPITPTPLIPRSPLPPHSKHLTQTVSIIQIKAPLTMLVPAFTFKLDDVIKHKLVTIGKCKTSPLNFINLNPSNLLKIY